MTGASEVDTKALHVDADEMYGRGYGFVARRIEAAADELDRLRAERAVPGSVAKRVNAEMHAELVSLRARVAELESGESFHADVYAQLCELIEPHTIRQGKAGGWLPSSVVDSVGILLEKAAAAKELERDAGRYAWLRDTPWDMREPDLYVRGAALGNGYRSKLSGDDLDQAIDAAIGEKS